MFMARKEVVKRSVSGDNSSGIVGVVFGILSLLTLSVPGVVMGIVGLLFSLKQNKVMKNKWSKAGIILNILGIILGIIAIIFLYNFAINYLAQLQQLQGG